MSATGPTDRATDRAKDDCFGPADALMPLADALARLEADVHPVTGHQAVPLAEALGRILAEDLVAPMNVPPHDNSAVDGYAVRHGDLADNAETRLLVTERVAAGQFLDRSVRTGEAIRIFTGAPMPDGADTVIMQEDTERDGDQVVIRPGVKLGANRRRAGEDIKAGQTILSAGRVLKPQDIGLAASIGRTTLDVRDALRVAVFSTGDELSDPGADLPDGGIYDSNRFAIAAALRRMGCAVTDLGILPDREDAIGQALEDAAATHDLLITSGGVSLGEEDHVKPAVTARGALHFWRIAVKPGRPIALGQVGETPFIGLPGNPVAALVTLLRVGRVVVFRLAGRSDVHPVFHKVPAGFAMKKKTGRVEWLRVSLEAAADGPRVMKYPAQGSGILYSMVSSDGLVELPADLDRIELGDPLDFLSFNEVFA